jgi:hypothetical protein
VSATRIGNDATRAAALEAQGILHDELQARFGRVLRMVSDFYGMKQAAITVVGREELVVKASVGMAGASSFELEGSLTETTMIAERLVLIGEAMSDPMFYEHPSVVGPPYLRSLMGHPLRAAGGEIIGAFLMAHDQPREFTTAHREGFSRVAAWIEEELAKESDTQRAREVQRALQPRTNLRLPGHDIAGVLVAARDLGGDFYDWSAEGDTLTVTLGDVMGKGTGASLIAATIRGLMKAASQDDSLPRCLAIASAVLSEEMNEAGAFATLFHARLSTSTGVLRYVDAGHGLAVLVRPDGRFDRLADINLPLGIGDEFTEQRAVLAPGDTLVLFSDGVLDLYDDVPDALAEVAALTVSSGTAAELTERLRVMASTEGAADDVTVVVIRRDAT